MRAEWYTGEERCLCGGELIRLPAVPSGVFEKECLKCGSKIGETNIRPHLRPLDDSEPDAG